MEKVSTNVFMSSTRYSYQSLMKLEFSQQSLIRNIQTSNLIKICHVGAEDRRTDGEKDRHDEASSHFFAILPRRLNISHLFKPF